MPPVRFEPTIRVSDRPQTHALDRTATRIDMVDNYILQLSEIYRAWHDCDNCALTDIN
jgi:hypothetical protein